jgi:UDP-2,3-diacylglucosamine hydrolase
VSIFAVSDLHIHSAEDPLYAGLLRLIRECAHGDKLVLAGDVFDLFVGRKPVFMERYAEFFAELRAAGERGVETHYIEGNHDFQMAKVFRGSKTRLHAESVELADGGKRFFFAHGDLVDREDLGYRCLRAAFRSLPARALAYVLPGRALDAFGRTSSRYSREQKPALPAELPLKRRERLRLIFRNFAAEQLTRGYDYVVLGHCHDLDEMCFTVGGRVGQYINVGFPRTHGSFLSWSAGDAKIQRQKLHTEKA